MFVPSHGSQSGGDGGGGVLHGCPQALPHWRQSRCHSWKCPQQALTVADWGARWLLCVGSGAKALPLHEDASLLGTTGGMWPLQYLSRPRRVCRFLSQSVGLCPC